MGLTKQFAIIVVRTWEEQAKMEPPICMIITRYVLFRKNKDIRQSLLGPNRIKEGTTSLRTYTFDQNVAREELASMIILHEFPLNIVDYQGFRRFISSICPLFKHVYVEIPSGVISFMSRRWAK